MAAKKSAAGGYLYPMKQVCENNNWDWDIARKFLAAILAHRDVAPLLSDEHFSVDGTLIEAWASMKSFQPKAEAKGSEPPAAGSGGEGQTPVETQVCEPAAPAEAPAGRTGAAMPK